MSSLQWMRYEETYKKDKLKSLRRMRKGNLYNDNNSDFNIRNRQNCNIIYENDEFRLNKDSKKKEEMYKYMESKELFLKDNIRFYSPKFYNILDNIEKFIEDDKPTGKVMYYSDFRQDAGSEVFEKILIAAGYEKYNYNELDIDKAEDKDKKKRYTFITGSEDSEIRKKNKYAYNHIKNLNGEFIQMILISLKLS